MKKKEDPAIKVLKKHLEPSDNRSAQMDASVESSDFQSSLDYNQKQDQNNQFDQEQQNQNDYKNQDINFNKKEQEEFNQIKLQIESCQNSAIENHSAVLKKDNNIVEISLNNDQI